MVGLSVAMASVLTGLACFATRERSLRYFSYMGVKREAISKAVSYFDLRCAKPNPMDPVVESRSLIGEVRARSTQRAQAALNLVVHLASKIKWPCSEIEKLHEYVKGVYMRAKLAAIILAASLLAADFFYVSSSLVAWFLLIMFAVSCGVNEIAHLYWNRKVILYGRHLDRIECSEDIDPEQTVAVILELLAGELKWLVRFHLAGDYDGLVYTGQNQKKYGSHELRETILYPRET